MKKLLLAGAGILALGIASAQAADIQQRMPAKAPVYVAPMYNWTGFYVGINGGGGWGRSSFDGPFGTAGSFSTSGGMVGGTLGYNWQASSLVWGLEGDIDWANINGSAPCAGTTCSTRQRWLSTVRGRLGYDAGRFMPYVTGGAAFGNVRNTITGVGTASSTEAGWTVGAGIEAALIANWTAKVEYLYVGLGRGGNVAGSSAKVHDNLLRVGLNYRF